MGLGACRDRFLALGFTAQECDVFELVTAAATAVLALPVLHPMDREEFCHAFHVIQDKLLARPGLRAIGQGGET
jgi:hypothetical protein